MLTKNGVSASNDSKPNFSLLGDPALRLRYPKENVVTTAINGIAIEAFNDTIESWPGDAHQLIAIRSKQADSSHLNFGRHPIDGCGTSVGKTCFIGEREAVDLVRCRAVEVASLRGELCVKSN